MQRAFLLVGSEEGSDSRYHAALLPLVDRPFLQHVVERLVAEGIDAIDVIAFRDSAAVEELLSTGTRWGLDRVAYFPVADRREAATLLQSLATLALTDKAASHEPILLACADHLPIVPLKPYLLSGNPILPLDAATGDWTGWVIADPGTFAALPKSGGLSAWEETFAEARIPTVPVATTLSARTLPDLLQAQKTLLDQAYPGLLRTGREIEPGIHLSRNVVLHPTASICPPVFIGQDCRIGAGSEIGPYAVIGDGCIVDEGATISESLVLAGSYIGEEVEIRESLVDRSRLTNVRFGETIDLTGEFLLGDLSAAHERSLVGRFLNRLMSRWKAGV